MSRKGRARIRCECGLVLGVLAGRGLEVMPGVALILIQPDGAVWLVCRDCEVPRRFSAGMVLVKAAA